MPTKVVMPRLGEAVVEGMLTKWLKSIGEQVQENEPLFEVNTDKVDTEIPSPASGVLQEILAEEGSVVQVGSVLAVIGEPGEQVDSGSQPVATSSVAAQVTLASAPVSVNAQPAPLSPAADPTPRGAPGRERSLGFISPVVAKIASETGVDLQQVRGTGQGGRITKKDLLVYLEHKTAQPVVSTPVSPPSPPTIPSTPPDSIPAIPASITPVKIIPLTPVRRLTAEHMLSSKRTSPHVTTIMEVDMSRVIAHRKVNKEAFAIDGVNLTFTAYFVSATVTALKAYPIVNSSWTEQGIVVHREINIGMATSLGDEGLIVPVIKNADSLSLLGTARLINDLAGRARARQLKPDEVRGGTFSITNHGVSGSLFATPIISQPNSSILGIGVIQKRPVVIENPEGDSIAIRPMAFLGLTFDHRILDGAIADFFLSKIIESLHNWK